MGSVIHCEGAVNSLDFHRDGTWLVMGTTDSSIHLIDSLSGEEKKKLHTKSDGCGIVKYTHHESCLLVSSERNNFDVKYLCAYDNRYLQRYKGHTSKITSLSMSPLDDSFLTSSEDKSIRLWNLKSPKHLAKLQLPPRFESAYTSFDESGVVFGVMCQDYFTKNHHLKLFDARNFDAGPFEDILPESSIIERAVQNKALDWTHAQIQRCLQGAWSSFEFSTDGNHILVNTQSDLLLVLDGFRNDAEPIPVTMRKNEAGLVLGSCLAPNAKHVVTASEDNEILIFDYKSDSGGSSGSISNNSGSNAAVDGIGVASSNPALKSVLAGHVSAIGCIKCNPKYNVMASGCVNTVLWIPSTGPSAVA